MLVYPTSLKPNPFGYVMCNPEVGLEGVEGM